MKLYHIDRGGFLKAGETLDLIKDFYSSNTENEYFKDGISSHGRHYYLDEAEGNSWLIDAIFEYERRIYYPNKLSRYQSVFAFDEKGIMNFVELKYLNFLFYKIYEIESDYFEKYNFNLVRANTHCLISRNAKLYWENKEDPYESEDPIYEYLLKMPVKIIREVKLQEIKDIIEKQENKKR